MEVGRKNVFVLCMDEHNRKVLESMPDADQYRLHAVLSIDAITGDEIPFGAGLTAAQRILDNVEVPIDAIIGFWDFPVSSLIPLLRRRYGLPSVDLEEVVMCEHKYWSRLVQREVIDEYPQFTLVDPQSDRKAPPGLRFPMWVKPVKSFSSVLAFGVADQECSVPVVARHQIGALGGSLTIHRKTPAERDEGRKMISSLYGTASVVCRCGLPVITHPM